MQTQDFENAVADMARRQAERLRGMGYHFAAAEVDALMPDPIPAEDLPSEALIA
jgi:hypothetical protein